MRTKANLCLVTCAIGACLVLALPLAADWPDRWSGVEQSYHGRLGYRTETGMLEKWCALPNFSFEEQGGIEGWTSQSCNDCHVGAPWNPTRRRADCSLCHGVTNPTAADVPTVANCLNCHSKDTAKRGDAFTAETDAHLALGMLCQDCHLKTRTRRSDHDFLKGSALDTTERTLKGSLSCSTCHGESPHVREGYGLNPFLNQHFEKVACETCHTARRPMAALASRSWIDFTAEGKPVTAKRTPGWMPVYKWYDGAGPGEEGGYRLPILEMTARRDAPGAKIYPFNPVSVTWYVQFPGAAYDNIVPVPIVRSADADGDGHVSLAEVRTVVPRAAQRTADMNFSISHSVLPAGQAFKCRDCHGHRSWVLDWELLGYDGDPRTGP